MLVKLMPILPKKREQDIERQTIKPKGCGSFSETMLSHESARLSVGSALEEGRDVAPSA
jgi:hypothetical protein